MKRFQCLAEVLRMLLSVPDESDAILRDLLAHPLEHAQHPVTRLAVLAVWGQEGQGCAVVWHGRCSVVWPGVVKGCLGLVC